MDFNGVGLQFLKYKFANISDNNVKEGTFVGPQIRKLINE